MSCSAKKGLGSKMDTPIKEGLVWMCGMIDHNWEVYRARVDKDMEEQNKKEQEEKEARRERLRKKREL